MLSLQIKEPTIKSLVRQQIEDKIGEYANAPDMAKVFLLNIQNGANPQHEMHYLRLAMQRIMNDTESCIQILINLCKAYAPVSLPVISSYYGYINFISVDILCGLTACLNVSHQNEIHSLKLETKALNETIKKMTEIISRLKNEQNISSNNTNLDQMKIKSLQLEIKALNETINEIISRLQNEQNISSNNPNEIINDIISRHQNEQNISSKNTKLDQMNYNQMMNNDTWKEGVGSRRNKSDNNRSF